ncbi:MAG: metal ABC transporter substrate-binding protein [Bacteriovoracaceae bacterium]
MNSKILTLILLFLPFLSYAKINVITTTTDLEWLVKQIGGEKVEVESLLNGTEDPHYLDAMPHFIGKVANADMFCLVGLDLEIGWVPKILTKSGNQKVQSGGKGYCETGKTVKALDIPKGKIDRTQGDVHPMGNPHYHLGPNAFLQGGETVLNTLINLDSENAEYYLKNFDNLKTSLDQLKKKISGLLSSVKSKSFMEYHREFTYFFSEFGLKNVGAIESVPGVPPSAGRLARVSIQAKQEKIAVAIAATTSPKNITDKFERMSGTPVARLPMSIVKERGPQNYEELLKTIAMAIINKSKSGYGK